MSSYINTFLRTEITCFPQILDKFVGKYYNNKLINGATWVCVLWLLLHLLFDECTNVLLKKINFKEYLRIRIRESLWNIGFYSICFLYCSATLYKNNVDIFNIHHMITFDMEAVPGQYILGFIILKTYFIHATVWEMIKNGISFKFGNYLCLSIFMFCTYITRKIELTFLLITIISFSQIGIQLSKLLITVCRLDAYAYKFFCKFMLFLALMFFIFTHLIVLPVGFIAPLTYSLTRNSSSTTLWLINVSLWLWIGSEVFVNPLYRLLQHWISHVGEVKNTQCAGSIVDCSLFLPRDDIAYNILLMRQEMKEREAKIMSLRKPKNRNMLIQTLKCMVAIKKKINEKRLSESSDSDDSEISDNVTNEDDNDNMSDDEDESSDCKKKSEDDTKELELENT